MKMWVVIVEVMTAISLGLSNVMEFHLINNKGNTPTALFPRNKTTPNKSTGYHTKPSEPSVLEL